MKAKSLMVLGTASGVGKSVIAAGFCRILSDWGYRVAPFKAQNMSNNSYVTDEGGEIGRAQAVQAECARVRPHTDMNPVLLKPSEDNSSQVIVHGKALGHFKARDYFHEKQKIWAAVCESYDRLAYQYDVIVLEGAGSPAEVNLKKNDLVNMPMAAQAGASCVLVADIDRGGVFAQLLGTLDLLEAKERALIHGLIVNKFRGDQSLFDEGIRFLEERSGKKIWGVLPYERDLRLEEEDALSVETLRPEDLPARGLDIAVILLPRMSNFTDFEVLRQDSDIRLRYVRSVREIGRPDLLILPGTKSTLADLAYLRDNGFSEAILEFVEAGGRLMGICGGYQMLGKEIRDSQKAESDLGEGQGFGFFDMTTEFGGEKILRKEQKLLEIDAFGCRISGEADVYEIHMGKTEPVSYAALAANTTGRVVGTYYHGLFDHPDFRGAFFQALAKAAGKQRNPGCTSESWQNLKETHYNQWASSMSRALNLDFLKDTLDIPSATAH